MTTPNDFFQYLHKKAQAAFEQSPIYKKQESEGKKWGFSICGTPIQKRAPVILGINWGADKGEHTSQAVMPEDHEEFLSYRFIKRSKPYFEKYIRKEFLEKVNYANICFFRSPKANDLEPEDYVRSLPMLVDYLNFINPEQIIVLGTSEYGRLTKLFQEMHIPFSLTREPKANTAKGTVSAIVGELSLNGDGVGDVNMIWLPHPAYPLTNGARESLWQQAFEKYELTKHLPLDAEEIFSWRCEGGGAIYYRSATTGSFFLSSHAMDIDPYSGEWHQRIFILPTWEAVWQNFAMTLDGGKTSWTNLYPDPILPCHKDYKVFIKNEFKKEKKRLEIEGRTGDAMDDWERYLAN